MLDPTQLLATEIPDSTATHDARDTIIYGLGLGLGMDPTDEWALRYVTESALLPVPTMPFVLSWMRGWIPRYLKGIDFKGVVDAERSLTLHAPVPVSGVTRATLRVTDVIDKGSDKGALVVTERQLWSGDGTLIATMGQVLMARRNGGFGGEPRPAPPMPKLPALPPRAADHSIVTQTSPQQALIYRLTGDDNPLHSDPALARSAGFERPLLHGLSTFGLTAVAAMRAAAPAHESALHRMQARFLSPVFPGERLVTDVWLDGKNAIVQTSAPDRGVVVLTGVVQFA